MTGEDTEVLMSQVRESGSTEAPSPPRPCPKPQATPEMRARTVGHQRQRTPSICHLYVMPLLFLFLCIPISYHIYT